MLVPPHCSVVATAKGKGLTDEQTLGTVLLTLAASTLLVGLLIVLVGAQPAMHDR